MQLPNEINYTQIEAAVHTLLPDAPPTHLMAVHMGIRSVIVEWIEDTKVHTTTIPITHNQGAATEGGNTK